MSETKTLSPSALFAERPWRAEFGATLRLAWPLVLTQLCQVAIHTIDVLFIGQLGAEALAASALATGTFFTLFLFGMGLATAVSPLVAQARGARQYRQIRRSVRQGLWATMTVGLPIMLLLYFIEPILLALGQNPGVSARASEFMRIYLWALPAQLAFVVFRNFFAAMDRPRYGLIAAILGIAINTLLVWSLIFGHLGLPALGLRGAAIGSVAASYFMCGYLIFIATTDRRLKRFHVLARLWRPDWHLYREVWRIGAPIGVSYLFESSFFTFALFLMGLFSTEAQAAHTIAIQCASVAFMIPMGISIAATVRVGLAAGRGDYEHLPRAGAAAFILGMLGAITTATIFWTLPETLVGAFLDESASDAAKVQVLAMQFLSVAALFQLTDSGQVLAMGCLRGLKDTRVPMYIAGLGYWVVGVAASLLLGFTFGLEGYGVWLGLAGGLLVTAVLLTWRFHRLAHRYGRS